MEYLFLQKLFFDFKVFNARWCNQCCVRFYNNLIYIETKINFMFGMETPQMIM